MLFLDIFLLPSWLLVSQSLLGVCSWGLRKVRSAVFARPLKPSALCWYRNSFFLWKLHPNLRSSQPFTGHVLSTCCVPGSVLFPVIQG